MINAGQGYSQIPLTAFLGLFTESGATSLPEGASPQCWDVDFNIGSVFMRPGKQSALTFSGSSTGPNGCNSGTNVGAGLVPWNNPGNITAHDLQYASVAPETSQTTPLVLAGTGANASGFNPWINPSNAGSSVSYATYTSSSGNPSSPLQADMFSFGLIASVPVIGIEVSIQAFMNSISFTNSIKLQLTNNGIPVGNIKTINVSSISPSTYILGGAADNWGTTFLTTDDIGVQIIAQNGIGGGSRIYSVNNVQMAITYGLGSSAFLTAQQFGYSLPNLQLIGIQIGVTGFQSGSGLVTAQLLQDGAPVGEIKTFTLPGVPSRILLGGPTDMWGTTLAYSDLNSTHFGVQIQAIGEASVTEFVDFVDCTVWQVTGTQNFNWFKTYIQQTGQVSTLALDSTGDLWDENVTSDQGVLTSIFTGIVPNSFGKSVTLDDVEYIALSNLTNGVDMPRQWTGTELERVSQVGPGAPPTVTYTATTYPIVAATAGITQPTSVGSLAALLWSVGPGNSSTAGNVITIYYGGGTPNPTTADPNIQQGLGVVLAGFASVNGVSPNLTYIVQSVGITVGAGGLKYNTFTLVAPSVQLADVTSGGSLGTYQATLATITTTVPVPLVQVGTQISLSGDTVPAWDRSWEVLFTPNAAQLQITSTSLTANVATYDFVLITGTGPSAGQLVTVSGTSNGAGIFNVTQAVIATAGASSFTVALSSPDITAQAESGSAIVNGTEFQIDPAPLYAGTSTTAIFGNSGGGTLSISGGLGSGTRNCVVMFLTDEGYLTAPSPFVTFTLPNNASSIVVNRVPIGPPNVIARWFGFTGANGGNYFVIPEGVSVVSNNQTVNYSATIINDNTSTQANFTFTDAVLLASLAIDVQGNNLFAQKELGPSLGCISYADRMFYWGELQKITNFNNLTFDGGYYNTIQNTDTYPLGWTVDPTNGTGGSLQVSPLFGNSYLIENTTGSNQAILGLITQTAYQDQYNVNILNQQTAYSVRVTARTPSSATHGALVIDLFSPSFNKVYGSASFATSSMNSTMQIFTSTLLTTPFPSGLPQDLILRLSYQNSTNGDSIEIDRLEPFPTAQPVLTTQLDCSYVKNFEAFDGVTGVLDTVTENAQPVRAAFELYDELYIVKTGSICSTQDVSGVEPSGWSIRNVSNSVGTPSVNGVDYADNEASGGESYAVIAGRSGVYGFNGSEPILLSNAIRTLWNSINWKYGNTLWVRNDLVNRRIYVGVPLPTPNQWLPNAPVNTNPTTPNVILMMNYVAVPTFNDLLEASVRVSSFTGKILARDETQKWTIWNVQSPYGDFVQRNDLSAPLFLGNSMSTGKVYKLTEGSTNDDGSAINELYTTYGFVTPDTGVALQMGAVRKGYYMARGIINGSGSLGITTLPESLVSPYANVLAPFDLDTQVGDIEIPLNETASRLFMQFSTNAVGEYFSLSQLVMMMRQEPMAPVRGRNN